MNKNTIIGFLLIFLILIGYSYLTRPSEEQLEKARSERLKQDSLNKLKNESKIERLDSMKMADRVNQPAAENPISVVDSSITFDTNLSQLQRQHFGVFSNAASGNPKEIIVETENLKLKLNTLGGFFSYVELKKYQTYDSSKLVLFNSETNKFGFLLDDQRLESAELYFTPIIKTAKYRDNDSIVLKGDDQINIAMRVYPDDGMGGIDQTRYFEFDYVISAQDYMLDYKFNINGLSDYIAPGYSSIILNWQTDLSGKEKSGEQERLQTTVFYKFFNDNVDELSLRDEDASDDLETKVEWISFKQQFFSLSLIAESGFDRAKVRKFINNEADIDNYLQSMSAEIQVPLSGGDLQSIPMKIYYGPNKYNILSDYELSLEEQIPLGWGFFLLHWINRFVVIPVFDYLSHFGWNYGIIILILTVILKIVLFPIAYKTYLSSAKMRVLKPEIDEITAKFPKKEDAMKKQQATMDFYKKVGVNPMAGCLPMLLQMPILFALFRFFPASIELRQKSFLWAEDLSTYDSIWTFPNGFEIPFYGDHVSLFTLLMTVSTVFYTRLNQSMMGSSTTQMPGMKTMMYLMPIMFLGFFNNYAAGLSYYYFLANVITFIQMFAIRGLIDEDKLRLKLQENKKKPRKKSGFQKKLEEMAKQQQGQNKKKR